MTEITFKASARSHPKKIKVAEKTRMGGEGTIYFSLDGHYAIKVYKNPSSNKTQLLELIMGLFHGLPPDQETFIVPPLALVDKVDGTPRVGFLMKMVDPKYCELGNIMLSPQAAVPQFQNGKTWGAFLKVARSFANSLVVLHGKGCAHSDIHYRNFLADLDTGQCVMLEIDGVVVPAFLPPQVKGMMGYMAPEILTKDKSPSEQTDRHSLAVLILHTLLFRNVLTPLVEFDDDINRSEELGWGAKALFSENKANNQNRPTNLGIPLFRRGALSYRMLTPTLRGLTERAMVEGLFNPEKRPNSREWLTALATAVDELWMCPTCYQHFPYPHWLDPPARRSCPFCAQRVLAPFPVVLVLYEERGKHNYFPTGRFLVLGHGFQLYGDVTDSRRFPPFTRKHENPVGYIEWRSKEKQYYLINNSDEEWRAHSVDETQRLCAHKGQSLPMKKGSKFYFGEGKRLALVIQEADGFS